MPPGERASFRPERSRAALLQFLAARYLDIDLSPPSSLLEAVIHFFEQEAAVGLADDPNADMLFFEWGVYDWGQGAHFQISMTRQFIIAGEQDDDAISQLRLVLYHPPTPEAQALKVGNFRCDRKVDTPHLRAFVASHEALRLASSLQRLRAEIVWSPV